ncbi:hypothetical protein [Streptomyces dysideae]|uniref:hypothetical protein n=1 Tax=Streptomyces dysideae TaxID=909626 RepID=UPI0018FE8A0C|nr:hypothetical protein [Streptomyces dysideae]
MADAMDTVPFKTLVTQTSAVLLTHGVEVESTAVQGVVAHMISVMAKRVGMDEEEAVHLVTPEAVADIIMKAATEDEHGAAAPHAVRPVRIDDRVVDSPVESLGHLVMATSQAGKYASLNGDGPAAAYLLDLATEIGAALVQHHSGGRAAIPLGVLDEVAQLVDAVADHVQADGWSVCPCGEPHGQHETDAGAINAMRHHAALAREMRQQADQ